MNVRFQLIGFLLHLCCGVFFIVCLFVDFWSKQNPETTSVTHTFGLWNKCSMREREIGARSSSYKCTAYSEYEIQTLTVDKFSLRIFITLPPFIKSSRGLGITSMVFWFFAFLAGMSGLFSNNIPSRLQPILKSKNLSSPKISLFTFGVFNSPDAYGSKFDMLISTKRFLGIIAGLCCLISGIFFFAAVITWFFYLVHDIDDTYNGLSPYLGLRKPITSKEFNMEVDIGFILGERIHKIRRNAYKI